MISSARHPHLAPNSSPEPHPQIPHHLHESAITLKRDGVVVTLLPDAGLRVGSIVIAGRELLVRENGHPATWGIFPMAPWAGRLANASLVDRGGVAHHFPPTWGDHAFHGRLYLAEASERSVTGSGDAATMYAPLHSTAGWPFDARAEVSAALRGNAAAGELTITLTLVALVEQEVAIGWHPCFRRFVLDAAERIERGAEGLLTFAPSGVLARDPAMPGLHLAEVVQPAVDGGVATPGSGATWDDPFLGVTTPPRISWGEELTVELDAGSAATHWMVYDPDEALCVEPQIGPPDALHRGGAVLLGAGERVSLPLTLRWTSNL